MFKTLIEANQALEEQILQSKRAEDRFRALLEAVLDAIVIVDGDGKIVFVNAQTEKLFGYSQHELLGNRIELFIPEPYRAAPIADEDIAGTGAELELYARRKDGSEFPAEVILSPIETEEGILIATSIRDITERVKIVKSLAEERRLLQMLMNNIPDFIYFKDTDSRFTRVNLAHAQMLGVENPDDVVGKSDADFQAPHLAKSFLEEEIKVIHSGEVVVNREEFNPKPDGTPRWYSATKVPIKDSEGNITGIVGVTRDITQNKKIDAALRNSEEQFRSTFTYAAIGMALIGLDGKWLQVNNAVCEIVGYSEQELLTKTFQDITHPDDLDSDLQSVQQLLAGEIQSYQMEKRYFHKQGHEVWVLLSVSLVRDGEGKPLHFVSQIQNISDSKQTEAALRARAAEEREFQSGLTALHEITIELTKIDDLDEFYKRAVELGLQRLGFDRFGLLLYDPLHAEVMGTYGTDAQGKLVAEHHIRLDPAHLTGILLRAYQEPEHLVVIEENQLFSNLEPIGIGWNAVAVLWNGVEKLGWLAIDNGVKHMPISKPVLEILKLYASSLATLLAQKRTQIALVEQRNLLRTLIDHLPDYIYIKDSNSRFILANQATINSIGGSSDEDIIGKSDFDLNEPAIAEAYFAEEQALLKSGESLLNKEDTVSDAHGNKLYLSVTKIPLRDIHGRVIGLIGTNHNITERKQAEAQALELSKEREQVKILSDFIRDVSHDFRTPLATISSSLYLLTRAADPEKQKRYFETAEEQINRLTQLIDRLLIIGRLDSQAVLEFEQCDVNEALSGVEAKIVFDATPKQISVRKSLSESKLTVQANVAELSLALTELGKNAVMYTPAEGTITLRTRRENDQAVIEVSDTGMGISSADLPHIFQRLYRVDQARATTGGSGLGLSIAKRIIELHHGKLEVESTEGEGSTFRILLPLST
ncbi:MAG: PAS domain S-box protein [Anaerolineaceae bacterium]|nr:PAS domain S-box protein [Anaerolineaceae bacterium]